MLSARSPASSDEQRRFLRAADDQRPRVGRRCRGTGRARPRTYDGRSRSRRCGIRARTAAGSGASCLRRSTSGAFAADAPCLVNNSSQTVEGTTLRRTRARRSGSYNHYKQKKESRSNLLPPTVRTRATLSGNASNCRRPTRWCGCARAGKRLRMRFDCAPRAGREHWSMSGGSTWRNSPSCWNRPSRCARRGGPFMPAWSRLRMRLRAYAPPNKPVTVDWPDAIRVDGGLVGGGRLGWPASAAKTRAPPWLVFGAMIRTVTMSGNRGGRCIRSHRRWRRKGLGEIGGGRSDGELCASSDGCLRPVGRPTGFASLAHQYLTLLPREGNTGRRIEENGGLVVQRIGAGKGRAPQSLAKGLAKPSWLDPASGGPHL